MLDTMTPVRVNLPDAPTLIYPIGDVHIGSPQFARKKFEALLQRIAGEPNSYIVIVGDILNNALKSSVSNCYEETMRPSEQKKLAVELLRPVRDKILCGVEGNHEARSGKDADDDPLYDVFCKLDIEDRYRQDAVFLMLHINAEYKGNSDKRPTYCFCVTHGAGGGMYIGSAANKGERLGVVYDGIDCLIYGHVHKPIEFPVAKIRIDPNHGKITRQQIRVVICSSWLDYGGYPIRKMMLPTAQVLQQIKLSNRGKEIRVTQ